jgi:hypothetical protein
VNAVVELAGVHWVWTSERGQLVMDQMDQEVSIFKKASSFPTLYPSLI